MGQKIVIAGIGTEVGKTITSAIVCEALKAAYWKPIQAGDLENSDSLVVKKLTSIDRIFPERFQLKTPMSPHESARIDDVKMSIKDLSIPDCKDDLIIELAGGLMVPINNDELFIDFISTNDLEVILVVSYYLGSINHSLLSIETLKRRGVKISGLIFSGKKVNSSFDIITSYSGLPVLLEIDHEQDITPKTIKKYSHQFLSNWK